MKNSQLSKIFSTTVFASSMIALGGCNQGSQERQRYTTIHNIKTHTIQWHFENKCIAILDSEQASLREIDRAKNLSSSDKDDLRWSVARSTQSAIKSKNKNIPEYQCSLFGNKTPLNPPMLDVIKNSQSLTSIDKKELLRSMGFQD